MATECAYNLDEKSDYNETNQNWIKWLMGIYTFPNQNQILFKSCINLGHKGYVS